MYLVFFVHVSLNANELMVHTQFPEEGGVCTALSKTKGAVQCDVMQWETAYGLLGLKKGVCGCLPV